METLSSDLSFICYLFKSDPTPQYLTSGFRKSGKRSCLILTERREFPDALKGKLLNVAHENALQTSPA